MREPSALSVNLLAVDIGNTNITLGAFSGGNLAREWRIASRPHRTADEYGALLHQLLDREGFSPKRMILGSVIPALESEWERLGREILGIEVRVLRPGDPELLPLNVDNPSEVGVDRIVDSWTALQKYKPPLVVIDVGTAVTFDVVGPEGDYRGGIILPGLELGAEALFTRTALLPRVKIQRPPSAIGRNTVDCIRSGLYFGWLEMLRGLTVRLKAEFEQPVTLIATGGLARTFAEDADFADHFETNLILEGLNLIDQKWEQLK